MKRNNLEYRLSPSGIVLLFAISAFFCILLTLSPHFATAEDNCQTPTSCQDILNCAPDADDGEYTIYANGNVFDVYCHDMAGTPKEYLTLMKTGGDFNFSQYTAGGATPGYPFPRESVCTNYYKIRIDPETLLIDIGDRTFSSTTGFLWHSETSRGQIHPVYSMPYANAYDCVSYYSSTGIANIDLSGTPFFIADDFAPYDWCPAGSATFSSNNQVVDLTGGGYCGGNGPTPYDGISFSHSPGNFRLNLGYIGSTADSDGDGILDGEDNCPLIANPDQADSDGDGAGDLCDTCPNDALNDADEDGICGDTDNCPEISNPNQEDFPDADGIGNECDPDDDNDDVLDDQDNCPLHSNSDQNDLDQDGAGDICDTDDDNDDILDANDECLATGPGEVVNDVGCSISDLCPCDNAWKNHGGYVQCVAHASEEFLADGLITYDVKDSIVSDAGSSDCGHKE